jgi:hypothetical protein
LTTTTQKWKRHKACSAARTGCRNQCAEEAATTSLPRPTNPQTTRELLEVLARTQACYNSCEERFIACDKGDVKPTEAARNADAAP